MSCPAFRLCITACSATCPPARRLVQPKDRGASIEVDGERVPLGIPQVMAVWCSKGSAADSSSAQRCRRGVDWKWSRRHT